RDYSLRRQTVIAGAVDLLRLRVGGNLLQKRVDSGAKGIVESAVAAEDRISIGLLDPVARRIERYLAPHILQHESTFRAGHLAPLHRVAALNVVAAREVAYRAARELEVDGRRGPEG